VLIYIAYVKFKLTKMVTEQHFNEVMDKIFLRFDQQDDMFGRIFKKFDQIDERFSRIEGRFSRIDERFERVEGKLDDFIVETKASNFKMDQRVTHLENWASAR
jgi:hypothetical protein